MGILLMAILMAAGMAPDQAAYEHEIEAWRQDREVRLRADGGWLTLAGLFWLKPGRNTFGTDPGNDIVLPTHAPTAAAPAAPAPALAHAGALLLDGREVAVEMADGVRATIGGGPVTKQLLRSDADGASPDVLVIGPLSIQVIERHGRLGVRLKDNESRARREFSGLHHYPIRAGLRVVARFVPHPTPVVIPVPTVLGVSEPMPSPGTAWFELGGQRVHLDPVIEGPGERRLFFIFRDQTAGRTTYGSGRFLYADPPTDGKIVLDFNKAYTPPCGFTPYATCPLPPSQNRLPVAVEAGELYDGKH